MPDEEKIRRLTLDPLFDKIKDLNSNISDLRHEVQTANTSITQMNTDSQWMRRQSDANTTEITSLKDKIASIEARMVSDVRGDLGKHENRLTLLEASRQSDGENSNKSVAMWQFAIGLLVSVGGTIIALVALFQ